MSRKPNTRPAPPKASLKVRLQRAREQRHFDQAATLAGLILEQSLTGPDADEARAALLEVIGHLVPIDAKRARTFLGQAERFEIADDAWNTKLAILWAKLGDVEHAKGRLARVADPAAPAKVTAILADHALIRAAEGNTAPADEWQPGLGLVRQAFDAYARGDDAAAREALQQIGLTSPFLEWKLLLRGMMAYSAGEDGKAIDNWARLDPERTPARLVQPLRSQIDPTYRGSLPPADAKNVERRLGAFVDPLAGSLREVQRLMGTPETLEEALRRVTPLIEPFRQQRPEYLPRLANCFYWLIVHGGRPEDLHTYRRIFGAPVEDRGFHRMFALVMEQLRELDKANESWRKYEQEIAASPERWPGEAGKRARAMLWARMGDNAATHELDDSDEDELGDFFEMFMTSKKPPRGPKAPLKPGPEECFRKAIDLSPDWQPAVSRLIDWLGETDRPAEAEKVARAYVEKHPEADEIWVDLADLQMANDKFDEAAVTLKRVIEANPLDRQHRKMLAAINVDRARALILKRDYAGARVLLGEAAADGSDNLRDLARVLDVVAAEKEGAVVPTDWMAANAGRPVVAYMLLVESQRLKLAKATLAERDAAFNAAVARPLATQDLEDLAALLGLYRNEKPAYRGITTHEKKIMAALQAWLAAEPDAADLRRLGSQLLIRQLPKPLVDVVKNARRRFPADPAFMYLQGEQAILQKPKSFSARTVGRLFREVLRLTTDQHDAVSVQMREAIEQRRQQYPALDDEMSPRFNFFDRW